MTLRSLFVADGPSDLPLASHLAALCAESGREVEVTPVDPERLGGTGRRVEDRLRFLLTQGAEVDMFFVHRDAEGQPVELRQTEIEAGSERAGVMVPVVPVIPVRMTEAWLLLDEAEIRRVAGRPRGRTPLSLPAARSVESIPDPKQVLLDTLLSACELTGRRRAQFRRDFSRHRRLLLQRIDRNGPINQLTAWSQLKENIADALTNVPGSK